MTKFWVIMSSRDHNTQAPAANMGYWKNIQERRTDSIHEANRALFDLVSGAAVLSANDEHVVDVGCGFGTNMQRCLERYPVGKITGLNISPLQAGWAQQFLAKAGVAERGEVVLGSATSMPFADESIDKMLSVEAAFHFETRERFLREAQRVLKPGGMLSLADLIVCRPRSWRQKLCVQSIRSGLAVPAENIGNYQDYLKAITDSGLIVLKHTSIARDVIGPFLRWFWAKPLAAVCRYNLFWSIACCGFLFAELDYVHVVAQKPK